MEGHRPLLVEIQALVVDAQPLPSPRRSAQGLDSGRLSLLLAVLGERAGFHAPTADVYALAVGGVKVRRARRRSRRRPGRGLGRSSTGRCPPTWSSAARSASAASCARSPRADRRLAEAGPARLHRGHRAPPGARARPPASAVLRAGNLAEAVAPRRPDRLMAVSLPLTRPVRPSSLLAEARGRPARRYATNYTPTVARRRSDALLDALAAVAPGQAPAGGPRPHPAVRAWARSIVVGDGPEVLNICSGGFLLDAAFSPQRLSELAKMDGAIILAPDASRIARANVHLVPNPNVPTSETGTRHRTAERVARSIDVPVISVSEDMSIIAVLRGRREAPAGADPPAARPGQPGAADPRALQEPPRRGVRQTCPRSRSRTSSPSATWSCCCSAPRWCCASPRRSRSTSSSSAPTAASCACSSRRSWAASRTSAAWWCATTSTRTTDWHLDEAMAGAGRSSTPRSCST